MPAAQRPLELAAVVEDVLPLVRPACEHAHIDLQFVRPAESRAVVGDSHTIGQLLINLLLNAIEAASAVRGTAANGSGGIVRMEIGREPDGRVVCRVSDSGPGPDAAVAARLGEPFVTDKPDGTGLGLAVVRQIAEEHGAELSWRRDGGLTQFTVAFPAVAKEPVANASG
jgi:signal transduction histidine kinase